MVTINLTIIVFLFLLCIVSGDHFWVDYSFNIEHQQNWAFVRENKSINNMYLRTDSIIWIMHRLKSLYIHLLFTILPVICSCHPWISDSFALSCISLGFHCIVMSVDPGTVPHVLLPLIYDILKPFTISQLTWEQYHIDLISTRTLWIIRYSRLLNLRMSDSLTTTFPKG